MVQLEAIFNQRGDPITNWNRDKLQFKLQGPLAMHAGLGNEGNLSKTVEVVDFKAPIQKFGMAQGSTLLI